ncbi:MAG: hypothetical protein F6K42_21830, partial [Leptolyngbya sp. SIO1D8]|nr:hypothetical protein [Leptolyngbya sp. SIO1D8]
MAEFTSYEPGTFCWVDLATTDAEKAKKFYGELFGWGATDVLNEEGMTYTMLEKAGKNVCALYQMPDSRTSRAVSPFSTMARMGVLRVRSSDRRCEQNRSPSERS